MGTGGHSPSLNGQDHVVVQAAAGQMAQLDLRAQWLWKILLNFTCLLAAS
eukprot:COSAG02_NODE_12532_length_1530_cov_2.647100_1_plen_50_part_00